MIAEHVVRVRDYSRLFLSNKFKIQFLDKSFTYEDISWRENLYFFVISG